MTDTATSTDSESTLPAQNLSIIQRYSIGIAAINLPLGSDVLEVTPIEKTPMVDGEITDNYAHSTTTTTDSQGVSEEVKTSTTATITAKWLPLSSNRFTPPNVRRGEEADIWKVGDSDIYYWSSSKYDSDKRKLETVIYTFSNTKDEGVKSTSQNTVFMEISTHNKTLHVRWNNSDGEPHAWDIQLNAKESIFVITDDIENQISIHSLERLIELLNTDGTNVRLDKKDLNVFAPDNISFKCGKDFSISVGGRMQQQVSGTWTWNTGEVTGTYPSAQYNNSNTTFSKDINVAGMTTTGGLTSLNTSGVGGFEVRGDGRFTGGFKVDGSISVDGSITAGGTIHGSNI